MPEMRASHGYSAMARRSSRDERWRSSGNPNSEALMGYITRMDLIEAAIQPGKPVVSFIEIG
jgi:hypothetical protein